MKRRISLLWLAAAAALAFETGCDASAHAGSSEAVDAAASRPQVDDAKVAGMLADAPLEPYQEQLLDLAFSAASKMPLQPHIKNRSRAQEGVIVACLEMGQAKRAFAYSGDVANWRQGIGYADLASYLVDEGHEEPARDLLQLAAGVEDRVEDAESDPNAQGWRKGRIRVKLAKTYLKLGEKERIAELVQGVDDADIAELRAVEADLLEESQLEEAYAALDAEVEAKGFAGGQVAIETYLRLFDRFYEDGERRKLLDEKISTTFKMLPMQIHVEALLQMAHAAREHGDDAGALGFVNRAQDVLGTVSWPAEHHVAWEATIAKWRNRVGDEERARSQADGALAQFHAERERIVDIFRTEALVPLAEAYAEMEDLAAALGVYRLALEEAVHNPNSRPRAEDVATICTSMSKNGIAPDEELMERIAKAHDSLGDPW